MSLHADTFGSDANSFTIDFVSVGNPGNPNDAPFDDQFPDYSSPYGGVDYSYRMAVTEVPQDWITKATNLGLIGVTADAWTDSQPAADIQWFKAAAFINWLNTSTGHHSAYDLTFANGEWSMALWSSDSAWDNDPGPGQELNLYRHGDAYYFLPSEDEWYKTAYHKNDGATAHYWDYATGSDTEPTAVVSGTASGTVVYRGSLSGSPASVYNSGGLSPYGKRGQNGNVWEWMESAQDGVNDSPFENRPRRGSSWIAQPIDINFSNRTFRGDPPNAYNAGSGFRVASVPEPSAVILTISASLMCSLRRCRY